MATRANQIKRDLRQLDRREPVRKSDFLSSGSTVLNMAMTGRPYGGFFKGHYFFVVGDSNSGKTFLGWTCLAEATINSAFDDYRLIFDDVEGGSLMDLERFFGSKLVERIEAPRIVNGQPVYSRTAQDFYYNVHAALKDGRPFIYVLDSQDSLTSIEELKKFEKTMRAIRKVDSDEASEDDKKDAGKGSYTDSKAKVHSENLRKLMGPLRDSGSILIVLNQTRDSFDLFVKSTYSGGRALVFYSEVTIWSSVQQTMTKMVREKKREIGTLARVKVRRSRVTGKGCSVTVPILNSCGIDDIGGCIDYLVDEGTWKCVKGVIDVVGLGPRFKARREQLVEHIEDEELESDLRDMVALTWEEIESKCVIERKNRYE